MPRSRRKPARPGTRRRVRAPRLGGALSRVAIVGALVLLAFASRSPGADGVRVAAVASTGAVTHSNSRDGLAILSAADLRPGASASGTVTIGNQGDSAGAFALSADGLTETLGRDGGRLAPSLQLLVRDTGSAQTVYSGPLSGLTSRALGTFPRGEERTYRFDVSLPDGQPGADALQGGSARVSFRWSSEPAPDPDPDPGPDPPADGGDSTGGTSGSGGTGTTIAPPPAADTQPPKLALRAARAQKLRRGAAVLTATCDEPCRIVGVSARGAKWKGPAELKAGAAAKISIKLSKKDARKLAAALKKRRKAVLRLKLTAADRAGNRTTAAVKIALKR